MLQPQGVHRDEARLLMSAAKFPKRSPLFTGVLFNHYSTKSDEGYLSA